MIESGAGPAPRAPGWRDADHAHWLVAEVRDLDRWCKATEALLAEIRQLQRREQAASLHLHPPLRNRLLWRIRHVRRNRKLRHDFDAVDARLRAEFDAALSDYQDRAGDLSAHVDERQRHMAKFWRQEDERWRRQRRGRGGNSVSGPSSTYGSDAGGGASRRPRRGPAATEPSARFGPSSPADASRQTA
jgi:hypothetical protein